MHVDTYIMIRAESPSEMVLFSSASIMPTLLLPGSLRHDLRHSIGEERVYHSDEVRKLSLGSLDLTDLTLR